MYYYRHVCHILIHVFPQITVYYWTTTKINIYDLNLKILIQHKYKLQFLVLFNYTPT